LYYKVVMVRKCWKLMKKKEKKIKRSNITVYVCRKGVGRAKDWVVGIQEDRGIKVEWQG
jgi:hypothetical protein